jgi:quercetin dioxygenase-like cupin family protein
MKGELRYFEMAAGGYSTLERHQHVHAVLILRGRGQCMIGGEVFDLSQNDLVTIEPMTWHQFRANAGEPMGFLCMVNVDRDKPQLPTEAERDALAADPKAKAFFAT